MLQRYLTTPLSALTAALVLTGCVSMAPHYERPTSPVPATVGSVVENETSASVAATGWRDFFVDERLKSLIELALKNNRDLRVAVLNIEAARAQYGVQRADQVPNLNAGANMTRARAAPDVSDVPGGVITENYAAQLAAASFELDLFGRVRSLSNAALESYFATREARDAVQVSLIAQVAQDYVAQLVAQENMAIASKALATREQTHKLVQLRFKVGVISAIDLRNNEVLIESAKADLATAKRSYEQAGNTLALLVGQALPADLPQGAALGQQLATNYLPVGVQSEVLLARPDIRQSEHSLRSANANIGAARAAFFPRITLTGEFGGASHDLDNLFLGVNRAWSFVPSISLPIFDAGRNSANLDLAHARKNIAVANYEKAVQTAFQEVSDALVARATYRDQLAAVQASNKAQSDRLRLVRMRYNNGIASALDLLDAERSSYSSDQTLLAVRQQQINNAITLYKVLGGGVLENTAAAAQP